MDSLAGPFVTPSADNDIDFRTGDGKDSQEVIKTYGNNNLLRDRESSLLFFDVHSSLCIVSYYLKDLLSSILKEQLTSNLDAITRSFSNCSSLQQSRNGVQKSHSYINQAIPTSSTCNEITSKKSRPKRGQYRKYNSALLVEAVKAVQRGEMSVHRAGSFYGVPHSTLEYKVKERHLLRQKKNQEKEYQLKDIFSPSYKVKSANKEFENITLHKSSHEALNQKEISVTLDRGLPNKQTHHISCPQNTRFQQKTVCKISDNMHYFKDPWHYDHSVRIHTEYSFPRLVTESEPIISSNDTHFQSNK